MTEENKKIEIPNLKTFKTGPGSHVKTERETIKNKDLSEHLHSILTDAANMLKPEGLSQQGYAVVFLYDKLKFDGSMEAQFICKADFKFGVPEQMASAAIKELSGKCMEVYGRQRPRTRT